jgi:hypothetical protein
MTEIIDLEYVADHGNHGDFPLCGEPIKHGQTRAKINTGNDTTEWIHDTCAETQPRAMS